MTDFAKCEFRSALLAALMVLALGHMNTPVLAEQRASAVFGAATPDIVKPRVQIPPLLGPNDLSRLMDVETPYIVDIRSPKAVMPRYSYKAGHIPGSVNVPYGDWRKLWHDPLNVPDDAALTRFVRAAGLTHDKPIVIVHSSAAKGNFGSAAFVYWMLKSTGFERIAILNGGISGWKNAGGAMSKDKTQITPSEISVTLSEVWLATHEDVDAVLAGTSHAQLLDARPLHQAAKNAPLDGAFKLNAEELITGQGATAASDQSIFMRIKQADLDWEYSDVITYCNNGALAAVDWFMASEIAEIPNVRIYAHSLKARDRAKALRQSRPTH